MSDVAQEAEEVLTGVIQKAHGDHANVEKSRRQAEIAVRALAEAGLLATPARGDDVPSFTCPRCGATSHHTMDVKEGYCGRCHDWTPDE